MFLEKHWFTLLLTGILIAIAANAKAEIKTDKWIEASPYMYDWSTHGTGIPNMERFYDSDADVVCYKMSNASGQACVPNNSDKLREKYRKYREFIEREARLEYEAKKNGQ